MKKVFFPVCVLISAMLINGCKEKGCTDKRAINYNSVATEDDGSCIICQSTESEIASKTADLVDNNFSSPHYNQVVARFTVRQKSLVFNNGLCGSHQCSFVVSVQSLVNQPMYMYYQLSSTGDIYFNTYKFLTIPANQNLTSDTVPNTSVSNPCGQLTNSLVSVYSSNITYQ